MKNLVFIFKVYYLQRYAELRGGRASAEFLDRLWVLALVVHQRVHKYVKSVFTDDNQSRAFLVKLKFADRPWQGLYDDRLLLIGSLLKVYDLQSLLVRPTF